MSVAPPFDAPILVVKPEWLELILSGEKTLEIRSTACRKAIGTTVFFSPSRSGAITGCATFEGSTSIDCDEAWASLRAHHRVPGGRPYRNTNGWKFCNATRLDPIRYAVCPGTVVWRKYRPPVGSELGMPS